MINPMDLSGKIILVTGASSGIGRATAVQLSKLGARVILIARNENKLKETITMMEGEGHALYPFDLNLLDNIDGLIKHVVRENAAINGLVHCAGVGPLRPLGLTKSNFLHEVMLINFYSFVELVRCLSKKNNYAKGASFVGISSISSKMGYKSKIAYCSSKAALDGAVRCMAKELAEKNIRVNTVMPGWVKTEMYTDYIEKHVSNPDAEKEMGSQYMGISEPEDIANAVAYLLCDSTKTITGSSFLIDGGYLS